MLGWDAAGIVREVGPDVTQSELGDEVHYAGSITRPGTNAEFHLVDARIVGHKPASLSLGGSGGAAADDVDGLGVRCSTAWTWPRTLRGGGDPHHRWRGGWVDRRPDRSDSTDLTVIATASRPETQEWVRGLELTTSSTILVRSRHRSPNSASVFPLSSSSTTHTEQHVADIAELIALRRLIDDPKAFDIMVFKRKAVSIHHELMFTRSIYGTPGHE